MSEFGAGVVDFGKVFTLNNCIMADSGFPYQLKPFKRYLVQANQIQKVNPVVAYYCRLFALTKMIQDPKSKKDPVVMDFVKDLMNRLEKDKSVVGDKEEDYVVVKGMADGVFDRADTEDKEDGATIKTSHAFMTSFVLFEVLDVFEGTAGRSADDAEVNQKCRYAKWKAGDISKAIKEGRTPTRGGLNEANNEEEKVKASAPSSAADDEEESEARRLPDPPKRITTRDLDDEAPSYDEVKGKNEEASGSKVGIEARKAAKKEAALDKLKQPKGKGMKGLNPKDKELMDRLKKIQDITREALSAMRFNDVGAAKERLRDAIRAIDQLK